MHTYIIILQAAHLTTPLLVHNSRHIHHLNPTINGCSDFQLVFFMIKHAHLHNYTTSSTFNNSITCT